MPHHPEKTVTGKVTHVFAHRFVVDTDAGAVLADLTPHGQEKVRLTVGEHVTLRGEMKPSELKVSEATRNGETVRIDHNKKHGPDHHAPADPVIVVRAARDAGYEPVGEPRRKPKHFEVLGRKDGTHVELHIELDGHIRKTKPAEADDPKWRASA